MVLQILWTAISTIIPSQYYLHVVVSIAVIAVVHAFAQGRTTNRERDLHARVILVTGGFTPLGLTLLQALAQRGAHIIALSPYPVEDFRTETLIDLLRSTTSNEQIYAEECDLASPKSVRAFCTRFLTGQENRLDAMIFTHEYQHIGSLFSSKNAADPENDRQSSSMATFLMITLLLPALLVAPVERDIRIVNVINPFYAAAAPSFSAALTLPTSSATFQREGWRSLRTIILTRHLQRVLDALPSGGQVPTTDENTVPVVSDKLQRSNIVAVSVSPGVSRTDTVSPLLGAHGSSSSHSLLGFILYVILQPILRIFVKSPRSALQSILHVLFLPTPYKHRSTDKPGSAPEEVLKPGALYSECAVVRLRVPPVPQSETTDTDGAQTLVDDGELGGQDVGRVVWEGFEECLKNWEKTSTVDEKSGNTTPPSVDTQSG